MTIVDILSAHNPQILGNGQIRSECPFRENHSGKTTTGLGEYSFFLSPNINAYHCFSCKAKGRITTLLTDKFNVPYYSALELVNIETYIPTKKEFELDIMWSLSPPKSFLDRGFPSELLRKYKVGTDEKENIVIPCYFDDVLKGLKFRNDRSFWYNKGFPKQEYLYNYHKLPTEDYVIITEGETDVWRATMYGYNCEGLLGVSFSEEQKKLIVDRYKIVYLGLDTDEPGIVATDKIYNSLKNHVEVRILNLPAKDIDSVPQRKFNQCFKYYCDYAEFKILAL